MQDQHVLTTQRALLAESRRQRVVIVLQDRHRRWEHVTVHRVRRRQGAARLVTRLLVLLTRRLRVQRVDNVR